MRMTRDRLETLRLIASFEPELPIWKQGLELKYSKKEIRKIFRNIYALKKMGLIEEKKVGKYSGKTYFLSERGLKTLESQKSQKLISIEEEEEEVMGK
jgi:chromosome segregation and condensation protein ScpB